MDPDSARARVGDARVGFLATADGAGLPHVVPVCFALVRDTLYTAVDHKPKRSRRLRRLVNIEANPRASLLVSEYDDDWSRLWWVRVDAAARVVADQTERETALDELAAKYPQYRERRPDGDVIALDADRWSAWSGE